MATTKKAPEKPAVANTCQFCGTVLTSLHVMIPATGPSEQIYICQKCGNIKAQAL